MKYYNLPGKLIAELWYLWPKKGQIWASGRRREHPLPHFLYSTVIYAVVILFTVGSFAGWSIGSRITSQAASGPMQSEAGQIEASPSEENAIPIEVAEEFSADPEVPLAEAAEEPAQDPVQIFPGPTSEIDTAMAAAFKSGSPVRWESADAKGYAVPSEIEASTGCRSLYYSDDSKSGWTSSPQTICP